jgi:predicted RNA-binding Zn-ribbon protein involved in translation (DUF1610 family)
MGNVNEISFDVPPKEDYGVENKAIETLLKKNKMVYFGCPDCHSPAIYFNKTSRQILEPFVSVPGRDPDPEVNLKITSNKEAFDDGTLSVADKKSISELVDNSEQLDMGDNKPKQPEKKPNPIKSTNRKLASDFGGKVLSDHGLKPTEEFSPEEVESSRFPEQLSAPKRREKKKRKRVQFSKKCRKCKSDFVTKHGSVLHCPNCLMGFTT